MHKIWYNWSCCSPQNFNFYILNYSLFFSLCLFFVLFLFSQFFLNFHISELIKFLGDYINTFSGKDYYSFPTLAKLKTAKEDELDSLGFGYRSKYIVKSVEQV